MDVTQVTVYLGRDNAATVQLERYSPARRQNLPVDTSAVTRMLLTLVGSDPLIQFDSDLQPGSVAWNGTGLITFGLSDYAIDPGGYAVQLVAFSPAAPDGEVISDSDISPVALEFRADYGQGVEPPPLVTFVPEAPEDGQLYGRKDAAWVPIDDVVAGVASVNGETGTVVLGAGDVGADVAGTAAAAVAAHVAAVDPHPQYTTAAEAAAAAPVQSVNSLTGTVVLTPGDIGAATAAQGAKADTAVQPATLTAWLDTKVDKVTGYGLSQENFTPAEKSKLAGMESSHFKGLFASLAALEAALPTGVPGDYADVDTGVGVDVQRYLWDDSDDAWVLQAGGGGTMTPAEIKSAYESNPDTNAYTDAEQAKLAGVAAGATANANTDSLAEGAANKYFTESRVRSAVLTGLSLLTGGAIAAADTLLVALGKLQNQISGKQDALVSGTTLKTVNGQSLLGAGNLAVSAVVATQSASSSGGVLDLSAATAQVVLVTLTENIGSIALPAGVAGQSVELRVRVTQGGSGNYTVNGWTGVSVEGGGSAPAAATGFGSITDYVLTNDNNTGWRMYLDASEGLGNRAINGDFSVNQLNPGATSGTVTLTAGQYGWAATGTKGFDRWKAGASGCTYSFSVAGGVTTLTITAGSLQQTISGGNLQSGMHTLSWAGTSQGKIGAGSYSASGVSAVVTGGSSLTIEFNTGTLALVQFEPGSAPTPFKHRLREQELDICRQYAKPLSPYGNLYSATGVSLFINYGPMRGTPALSLVNGGSSFSANLAGVGATTISGVTFATPSADIAVVNGTSSVSASVGTPLRAADQVWASAEL